MKRYEGGCAIMLGLDAQDVREVTESALAGIQLSPEWTVTDALHLTLQFVGRDLPQDTVAAVVGAGFEFAKGGPVPLRLTGSLEILKTGKGWYLVALVDPSILVPFRERLQRILEAKGVRPKDSFAFNPHITLAEAPRGSPTPDGGGLFEPFVVVSHEITVKYGPHRMTIEFEEEAK